MMVLRRFCLTIGSAVYRNYESGATGGDRLRLNVSTSAARTTLAPRVREQDDGHAGEADHRAGDIPQIGAMALDQPAPQQCRGDVDTAIGRIGAAGERAVGQREQMGKAGQRGHPRQQP
jgi:hypothetical protein